MAYIGKHWRGELSLATSFWINLFLINMGIMLFNTWLNEASPIKNPVISSQVTIIFSFIALAFIYPWQLIGLWRSANRHLKETKKGFWAGTVKVLIVLGFFVTLGDINNSWPIYKDIYQIGFGKDEYGDYRIEVINDGSIIHLKGRLGFGISDEINHLIAIHPNIKGIILDSIGGRVYEGRELSKIILINSLDTYTLEGCYSACGTAFISGNKRYLGKGANLAFHQYRGYSENFDPSVDLNSEQKKDLKIFQRRDINQDFIDRIFKAEQDDLWYPTVDEMLNAGVIHEVINPSNLKPIKYNFNINGLEEYFASNVAFQTIKKYEPEMYKHIIANLDVHIKKGTSMVEIKQDIASYVESLAFKYLPRTSDKALIMFTRENIEMLSKLEKKDPILCLKALYPEQYGTFTVTKYLSNEEMIPMFDALSLVIKDTYESTNTQLDTEAAEELLAEIVIQLGDDVQYMDTKKLGNKEEYSKACNIFIDFYELILSNNNKIAGNVLRYAYSE